MNITTGFGYIKDSNDNIIAKYELPIGEHPLKDGYSFVEVNDKESLDAVEVFVPPPTKEQETESIIQQTLRDIATLQLQTSGMLDENGVITAQGTASIQAKKAIKLQ